MDAPDRVKVITEYNVMYNSIYFWLVRAVGFCRIKVFKAQVVDTSTSNKVYGCVLIFAGLIASISILYTGVIVEQVFTVAEGLICAQITIVFVSILADITFFKDSKDFVNGFVDIDVVLGVDATKFMREPLKKIHYIVIMSVIVFEIVFVVLFYFVFDLNVENHIATSIFFTLALSMIFDANYAYVSYSFLNMRLKYLNLSIMKYSNMNPEYMPDVFLIDGIFWMRRYNDLVTFHNRARIGDYLDGFKLVFNQIRRLERCYRLLVFLSIVSVLIGSVSVMQAVILQNTKEINMIRKIIVSVWFVTPLLLLTVFSLLYDGLLRLLEQTKIICTYAQLKPTNSDAVFKLTKRIYEILQNQEPRMSVYNMFLFDTGFMLKLAASILVYITVQVQYTLYKRKYDVATT
ncbi:uncharacterized protein LOC113519948 [Galleria mellonella]|uniref:Gustatory receptor n=1 Tax=Galleria mellonella TaxID=7137 RepID=A0ABM3MAD5_GALME|nr:uncharacterized protein LOC113519948 [Galleria mellonella]